MVYQAGRSSAAARGGEHSDYQFSLANERTFLAWVCTALALLAGGITVVQIVPDFTIPAAWHILGIILILIATAIAATSYTRWERRERAIQLGGPFPPSLLPRLVGAGLAIVMLLALAFVLVEAVQGADDQPLMAPRTGRPGPASRTHLPRLATHRPRLRRRRRTAPAHRPIRQHPPRPIRRRWPTGRSPADHPRPAALPRHQPAVRNAHPTSNRRPVAAVAAVTTVLCLTGLGALLI